MGLGHHALDGCRHRRNGALVGIGYTEPPSYTHLAEVTTPFTARRLHEPPTLERLHIRSIQVEPFTVPTLRLETPMPIGLDAYGIIGLDDVNGDALFGKLDRQFA